MDLETKKKWVSALRSGKYLQGHGQLRKSNGQDQFCCLGVLQDLVAPEKWVQSITGWKADGCAGGLTIELMNKIKMDHHKTSILVDMNDGLTCGESEAGFPLFEIDHEPKSFKVIANYIEENM